MDRHEFKSRMRKAHKLCDSIEQRINEDRKMKEPTVRQHKKLEEINNEGGRTGRNGDESDIAMLYELVREGYLQNLVSMGIYQWNFVLTPEADDYLCAGGDRDGQM